jgi:hypothetical protein
MTPATLNKGIMILEAAFKNPHNFDDKFVEDIWLDALKGIPDADFFRAVKKCFKTCKFFPTPAEIIEAAIPDDVLSGSEAFEIVEREIDRCCGRPGVVPKIDDVVTCKVVASMGGLRGIWLDSRDRSFVRKEFIQRYNDMVTRERLQVTGGETKLLGDKDVKD